MQPCQIRSRAPFLAGQKKHRNLRCVRTQNEVILLATIIARISAIKMAIRFSLQSQENMARGALSSKNASPPQESVVAPKVRFHSSADSMRDGSRRKRVRGAGRMPQTVPRSYEFRYFVDRRGCQHFNFRQSVWLDPAIQMACTPIQTTALETLAVNLLTLVIRGRDCRTPIGYTSQRVIDLVPHFCAECLLASPPNAWVLPRATIKAWVDSHRSIKRCRDIGSRNRQIAR
jgi:hypothetical protein